MDSNTARRILSKLVSLLALSCMLFSFVGLPCPVVWAQDEQYGQIAYIGDDGNLWLMNMNGSNQTQLTHLTEDKVWMYTWSPDGSRIACLGEVSHKLYVVDLPEMSLHQVVGIERIYQLAWSPNGERLAVVTSGDMRATVGSSSWADDNRILLVDLANWKVQEIANGYTAQWAPDGKDLFYVSNYRETEDPPQEIRATSISGDVRVVTGSRELGTALPVESLTLSPDGTQIAAWGASLELVGMLWTLRTDGSDPRQVAEWVQPSQFDWSADGNWLVYRDEGEAFATDVGSTGLGRANSTTGETTMFLYDRYGGDEAYFASYPMWTPDGTRIIFCESRFVPLVGSEDVRLVMMDPSAQAEGLGEVTLTKGCPAAHPELGMGLAVSWSPDGQHLAVEQAGQICVVGIGCLADGHLPAWRPIAPRPSEERIAYIGLDGNVWLISSEGTNPTRVTDDTVEDVTGTNIIRYCCPSWSPDGNYLYFIRKIDDDSGVISEYNLLKEEERRIDLPELDIELSRVAVSPDGKRLAFVHNLPMDLPFPMHSHVACLSILELASEESFDLNCEEGVTWYQPVFSPSGDEVAVAAALGIDASAIIVIPLDGSESTMLASCCTSPDYLPDGSTLAVVASPFNDTIGPGPSGEYGIYRVDPTTKGLSPMFLLENRLIETADISEDGIRVVYQGYGSFDDWPYNPIIEVLDLDTGETEFVTAGHTPAWQPPFRGLVDLSISEVTPIQVLEGQPLVVDKATAVKVVVNKSGSGSAEDVQVRLTHGTEELTSFYVSEPDNWDDRFRLRHNNIAYRLNFTATETSKSIYFFGDALTPTEAGPYKVEAEVDPPPSLIPEAVEINNTTTITGKAYKARWGWPFPALRLRYISVEQLRSQAVMDFADAQTDFLGATYPVAASNLTHTVSSSSYTRCKQCQQPDWSGLVWTFNDLWLFGKIADLRADRIVGIAPVGWLLGSYPGYITSPNVKGVAPWPPRPWVALVEMESGIGTTAHEVGHTYALTDRIGAPDLYPVYDGLHVSSRKLMNDGDEKGQIRHGVYSIMSQASYDFPMRDLFVDVPDYQSLVVRSVVARETMAKLNAEEGIILAIGIIGQDNSAEFLDWYRLPEGAIDELVPGPYVLKAIGGEGEVLYEQHFTMSFTLMGDTIHPLEEAPFAFAMPFVPGTVEFELHHEGQVLTTRTVSAHAPIVEVLTPNEGEAMAGSTTIEWTAEDADGDTLSYAVLLSTDNGDSWNTAAVGLTTPVYSLEVSALPPGTGNQVKIIATDGVNTGQDVFDVPFTIGEVQSEKEEKEKGPATQPRCCAGLGGLVALPAIVTVLRARRRSPSSV